MRDGKTQLRLDRRLAQRRGWISPEELEKELAALPDVAEKAEMVDLPGSSAEAEPEPAGFTAEPIPGSTPDTDGGPGLH